MNWNWNNIQRKVFAHWNIHCVSIHGQRFVIQFPPISQPIDQRCSFILSLLQYNNNKANFSRTKRCTKNINNNSFYDIRFTIFFYPTYHASRKKLKGSNRYGCCKTFKKSDDNLSELKINKSNIIKLWFYNRLKNKRKCVNL